MMSKTGLAFNLFLVEHILTYCRAYWKCKFLICFNEGGSSNFCQNPGGGGRGVNAF
jgi:hypothetical protein